MLVEGIWRQGNNGQSHGKWVAAVHAHWAIGYIQHSTNQRRITTTPEGWLISARPLAAEQGGLTWYFRMLAADTLRVCLTTLAYLDWVIEQFYDDIKGEPRQDH